MIAILLTVAVAGFLVYLVTLIPMPAPFRAAIIGLAVLLLIVWILHGLGLVNLGGYRWRG
jgi:hypothetical protein